jgi:hypothetical protein
MAKTRTLLLFLVLPWTLCTFAQRPVRILDPAALLVMENPGTDTSVMAGMLAAGLEQERMERITRLSDPAQWAPAWRSDSARAASAPALPHVVAYHICDLVIQEEQFALVHIPAIENYHMPEGIRSSEDMYMIFMPAGLGEPPPPPKAKASRGPNWRNMPRARITRPREIYATYNIANDPYALEVLQQRGMSQAEIDAVIFRSHERNWPEGIDALEKRRTKVREFKKYKAHIAARWENKVLLVIPAELNKKLPPGLRPYMDIYMVYTGPAVAVMKK